MTGRWNLLRGTPMVFWVLALTAIVAWSLVPDYVIGWDSEVYVRAIRSLRAGHDPYLDGIAAQRLYHALALHRPGDTIPYSYVYCPITLPFLYALGFVKFESLQTIYWLIYFGCLFAGIWVGSRFVHPRESRALMLMAPAAVFFPGLLQNDAFFSGNIAYVLYGPLLLAALYGWREGRWWPFYIVLLGACLWKPHMLTMLALPLGSARRQWTASALTAVAGILSFVVQPILWPTLFKNYLVAADLQFQWNHDFGANPAAVLTHALGGWVEYHRFWAVAYLLFAASVVLSLARIRGRFLRGGLTLADWVPVLLIGTLLLNPRIMEYDVAAITVPLALVAWRFFGGITQAAGIAAICFLVFFFAINCFAPFAWNGTAPFVGDVVRSAVLLIVFCMGCWSLLRVPAKLGAQRDIQD